VYAFIAKIADYYNNQVHFRVYSRLYQSHFKIQHFIGSFCGGTRLDDGGIERKTITRQAQRARPSTSTARYSGRACGDACTIGEQVSQIYSLMPNQAVDNGLAFFFACGRIRVLKVRKVV